MDGYIQDSINQYRKLKLQLDALRIYLITAGVSEAELGTNQKIAITKKTKEESKPVSKAGIGIPKKRDMNWDLYSRIILRELGGTAKASDVAEYAKAANPKFDAGNVVDNVRSSLGRQGKAGDILLEPGSSKYEGNTYSLKTDDEVYGLAA
ncbi:MAG TPA: hypothetical protein VL728_08600 [Cyclobacteriaceae bacterium]|nr:hypothetical protein [Cyclobacteriaceae bacterium]